MNQTQQQPANGGAQSPAAATPVTASIDEILAATEERRFQTIAEQARIGFRSGYLPKHIASADQAVAIAMAGAELGLPPMTSFRVIHFFDGRVVLAAELMLALAHRRVPGFKLDIVKTTNEGCAIDAYRPGMTLPARIMFSFADAQLAGLADKKNWKTYPAAMCRARAIAAAVRAVAPEAALGVLVQEERDDDVRYEVSVPAGGGIEVTPKAVAATPPPPQGERSAAQAVRDAVNFPAAPKAPTGSWGAAARAPKEEPPPPADASPSAPSSEVEKGEAKPARAPRRTPEEAKSDDAKREAELVGEIALLHTRDECISWGESESVKTRRKKLTPGARSRVDEALEAREKELEEQEAAEGAAKDEDAGGRQPGDD